MDMKEPTKLGHKSIPNCGAYFIEHDSSNEQKCGKNKTVVHKYLSISTSTLDDNEDSGLENQSVEKEEIDVKTLVSMADKLVSEKESNYQVIISHTN